MSEQLHLEDEDIPITLRRAWDRALRMLATRVNKPTFEAHIRTLRPLAIRSEQEKGRPLSVITLGVPSAFTREWVEKRHAPLIQGLLEEILDSDVRVQFTLTPRPNRTEVSAQATQASVPSLFDEPVPSTDNLAPSGEGTGLVQAAVASPLPPVGGEGEALTLEPEVVVLPAPRTSLIPTRPVTERPKASPLPRSSGGSHPDAPLLNPRYTFDAFVVGRTNRLAHGGAWAVAQSPGAVYNPLFLYGPPGIGKTHLMHAIGHEVVQHLGTERVAYVSGEAFTTSFVNSLREGKTDEFRRRWRNVDVFLLDDIQFIVGKDKTNEEFFHTFNALHQTGKQVVISSDRSPRELRMMDERLRSRFECGLIADITAPDLETRLAILHKKADQERMRIPDEVLLYMAQLVQSNIRTLEGALVKLVAYASLVNSPVTTQLASDILERYFIAAGAGLGPEGITFSAGTSAPATGLPALPGRLSTGSVTAELIQRVVAQKFGLDPDALVGKRRDKETAKARQIAMHLMRELTETSLPGIGQLFGGRDHSTVLHACNNIREQMPEDDTLRQMVQDLVTQIRSQSPS